MEKKYLLDRPTARELPSIFGFHIIRESVSAPSKLEKN
jgi:hypothetical protein